VKRIFLILMVICIAGLSACTSGVSQGEKLMDEAHAFTVLSEQVIDRINNDIAPEEKAYLIIKYNIENLQDKNDVTRQWSDQIGISNVDGLYEMTMLGSLENQLWQTSLSAGENKTGYIAYTVPDDVQDFTLTFTFPVSETEVKYDFRPVDQRLSVNTDNVITRLEQMRKTKRIPVIGGLLSALSGSPIRYMGIILVPEEDIPQLLEQTADLSEDSARTIVENYLINNGIGQLE